MPDELDPGQQGARLEQAREWLRRSRYNVVFSGAGLSAESGLSTFRDPDPDALWSRFDPTELASVDGFETAPERVLEWYNWRRARHAAVQPNAAHLAFAQHPDLVQVTQNVDHLLEQAGVPPAAIHHLHGSLLHDRCHDADCGYRENIDLEDPPPPRACPRCGGPMRPAVVWFGEALPQDTWAEAQAHIEQAECLLVVGTSATVYPAAGLIALARDCGSRIIVVDPNPGAASGAADIFLRGSASDIVPRLLTDS